MDVPRLWDRPESLRALDVPQSDVGAPLPHVLADDYHLAFAYRLHVPDPDWDGTTIKIVDGTDEEPCAVVRVRPYYALRFGPPNDEALRGHRLSPLGLRPYAAFEVLHSAWIAELEQANRVHRAHDIESFKTLHHWLFTFHDSLLEVVARDLSISTRAGSLTRLVVEPSRSLSAA